MLAKNLLGVFAIIIGAGVIILAAVNDPSSLKVSVAVGGPNVILGAIALAIR